MTTFYTYPRFNRPKADVFKNATNNYAYPDKEACSGDADTTYFEFFPKENIGLIRGSNILSKINFQDFRIEVDSWNQETKIFEPGEISYVPGLTKGLMRETHVFPFPELNSNDISLDQYFMEIDASVSYFKNFTNYDKAVSASGDYEDRMGIESALNNELDTLNIPVSSDYDNDSISFTGNNDGFNYNIDNIQLTIIDASVDPNSPFDPSIVNGERVPRVYTLKEDSDKYIPSAKYPNGAFRGVLMKVDYPEDYYGDSLMDPDKYIYIHHVHNLVTFYDSSVINITRDVSVNYIVTRDSSIYNYIGVSKPFYDIDFSIQDISCNIDTSAGPYPDTSIYDGTTYGIFYNNTIYDETIDGSIISDHNVLDSSVINISLEESYIFGGQYTDASLSNMIIEKTIINSGIFIDGSIFDSSILYPISENYYMYNTYIDNMTSNGNNIFDNNVIEGSNLDLDTILCSDINSTNIVDSSIVRGTISDSDISDTSIYSTKVVNSILSGDNTYIEDASLSSVDSTGIYIKDSLIEDTSANKTFISKESIIKKGNFIDSSIQESSIEEDFKIEHSYISNSWVNQNINDFALRGEIDKTNVWDSSINNVDIHDSSIFNSMIYDSSLYNCTLINCNLNNVDKDDDTKNILLDPSIVVKYDTIEDSSTYYIKKTKRLNVGEVESTSDIIGAKDYLKLINDNDEWTKIGDLYSRITSAEQPSQEKTLANGMYIYNPHDFKVRVNYILIE